MHILITAGPTREYVDDVRYLSNASSGRMGYAIAEAALAARHAVTLVSGPTNLTPPAGATLCPVVSAQDMLEACLAVFDQCDGAVFVAAVADYRPEQRTAGKIKRTGETLVLRLTPNPDISAELAKRRDKQWLVGFALESSDAIANARGKLARKGVDLIVVNTTNVIGSDDTEVVVLGPDGETVASIAAAKHEVARRLVELIDGRFGG